MLKNVIVFVVVVIGVYIGADLVAGGTVPQIPQLSQQQGTPTPLLRNVTTKQSDELSTTLPTPRPVTSRLTNPPRVVVPTAVPVVIPDTREVYVPYELTLEELSGAYENVSVERLQELNPEIDRVVQGDTVYVPDDAKMRLTREEPTPVPPPDNIDPRLSQDTEENQASRHTAEEHNVRQQQIPPTPVPKPKVIDPRVTQKEVTPVPPTPMPTTQKTNEEENFQQQYVQPTATATWLYIDPRATQGED